MTTIDEEKRELETFPALRIPESAASRSGIEREGVRSESRLISMANLEERMAALRERVQRTVVALRDVASRMNNENVTCS